MYYQTWPWLIHIPISPAMSTPPPHPPLYSSDLSLWELSQAETPCYGTLEISEIQGPWRLALVASMMLLVANTISHHTSGTEFKDHSHHQQQGASAPLTPPPLSFCNRAHFKCGTSLKPHYCDEEEFSRYIPLGKVHLPEVNRGG